MENLTDNIGNTQGTGTGSLIPITTDNPISGSNVPSTTTAAPTITQSPMLLNNASSIGNADMIYNPTPTTPITPLGISFNESINTSASQRRSSSRSIKRKKFDDEIVESSLGGMNFGAFARASARTTSVSSPPMASTSANILSGMLQTPTPPIQSVPSSSSFSHQMPATPILSSSMIASPPAAAIERRRSTKSNRRRGRPKHNLATKDLGRWKPADDLALIIGVQQSNDLKTVHRGVKFSCRFTLAEIQGRWWALLYDKAVSKVAVQAMRNLHPEIISTVYSKALFSRSEEIILARVPANSQPVLTTFQSLLEQHSAVFLQSRTAKALLNHWQLMKQYHLLPDQTVQGMQREQSASLSDAEELIRDADLQDPRDENLAHEMQLADRSVQREVGRLEAEVKQWAVSIEHITGISAVEFDHQTLAVLRGRLVRYLMRSREITLGRTTKDHSVDVDLTLEGPSWKVSRRQGTIRMKNNGDFSIAAEGKRPIIVDGKPILPGNKYRLNNNSVVEIANLRFIFLVNQDLNTVIRQETAKLSIQ